MTISGFDIFVIDAREALFCRVGRVWADDDVLGSNGLMVDGTGVATADAAVAASRLTASKLHECSDCGALQILPPMPPRSRAVCLRCDAVLRHTRWDSLGVCTALNVTALVLFMIAGSLTMMSVTAGGQERAATLITGPVELEFYGLWELSIVVLITTFAAPLVRTIFMLIVLLGLRLPRPPSELRTIFAWVAHLRPWSMIEIYMLGLFVAYVRLSGMAKIELGPSVFALVGLMVILIAADVALDEQAVWEAMEPHNRRDRMQQRTAAVTHARDTAHRFRIGCDVCGLVSRSGPGFHCPRCGFRLRMRKPRSIQHAWAFWLAALALYIPANTYPVLTYVQIGWDESTTILGGVRELIEAQLWPLAALVFFASFVVPCMKLIGLAFLLISTQLGWTWRLHDRTVAYRIIDFIGRWSMIDIFMESILVGLVQFGKIASVYPGPGAIAFAAVVILTMLAARSFDPRLMWDNLPAHESEAPISALPLVPAEGRT
jgi:paraquat-inducible protein A